MLDHLIIGSGMSAVHAAQTLLEAGEKVAILDIGEVNEVSNANNYCNDDFYTLRKSNTDYSSIFLGSSLEGVFWGEMEHTLTVPRRYVIQKTGEYLPYEGFGFNLMQSASRGGLGNAWGAGACPYLDQEIIKMGLPVEPMRKSYRTIAKRIGICGASDDASQFFELKDIELDPPMEMDPPIRDIYQNYRKGRNSVSRDSIFMGKSPMAVITKPRVGRDAYDYSNMGFYNDVGNSVYRPSLTFEELSKFSTFTYLPKKLALRFDEINGVVSLRYIDLGDGREKSLSARKLYLGAGAFGSVRIALRSFRKTKTRSLLTNDYSVAIFCKLNSLGNNAESNKNALGQLEMFYSGASPLDTRMASLYTYSSLTLSRLIGQAPFMNYRIARKLLSRVQSSLVVASFNHPDFENSNNFLELIEKNNSLTKDILRVRYELSPEEQKFNRSVENKMVYKLLGLGCVPLVRKVMAPGSSAHYAGTMPISSGGEILSQSATGLLSQTSNVYSIDGAGFTFLPANGLTMSLMANADRVARGVLEEKAQK